MSEEQTHFKDWQSPLALEEVFSQAGKPSYLEIKNGILYWMEQNPEIGGATQIKCHYPSGETHTLTSAKLNVRTRANEYGGKAYCVGDDALYFCNDVDQRIYRLVLNSDFYTDFTDEDTELPDENTSSVIMDESFGDILDKDAPIDQAQPITTDDGRMYSDLCLSNDGRWLFFIMETPAEPENRTEIGVLSTQLGVNEPEVLASGCDFYSSLVLTENNQKIAWIEWRHPCMPWNETHVLIGSLTFDENNPLKAPHLESISNHLDSTISGIGSGASISHLTFEPVREEQKELTDIEQSQRLFMIIDWPGQEIGATKNFAQLYCWDGQTLFEITQGTNEYSYPHWVFGNHRYAFVEEDKVLAIATNQWSDELHLIDLKEEKIVRLADKFVHFSGVCAENGLAYVIGCTQNINAQVLRFSDMQIAVSPGNEILSPVNVSCAETILITPPDEEDSHKLSHAFFYPPKNVSYPSNNENELPPLLVMVHGGPTARASNHFDIQKQFWTTSGFAVLDVNHRGSTGYGRNYRDQLLGEWGVADAEDVKFAIEQVIDQGLVHPEQVFIRGKSAGGYAVQRALTLYPDMFAGGASYYGIGDLATLASITHKFESCYLDRLLGEKYHPEKSRKSDSLYYQRSPIHTIGEIKCPMILFQGLNDKVVPPELSQQVVTVLAENFTGYEYYTYPGEGHGFIGMSAKIDSLTKELLFYRKQMQDEYIG